MEKNFLRFFMILPPQSLDLHPLL
jgi:hypothetical protein